MIIGIYGRAGAGKTTLAKLLEARGFIRRPFATPIKIMLKALLEHQGVNPETIDEMLNGMLKETPTPFLAGRTPRHAMQTLGTEWRNLIAQNLWSTIWATKIARDHKVSFVVDDLRFKHEVDAIRWTAEAIGVRSCLVQIRRTGSGLISHSHASESNYAQFVPDLVIDNTDAPKSMLRTFDNFIRSTEKS